MSHFVEIMGIAVKLKIFSNFVTRKKHRIATLFYDAMIQILSGHQKSFLRLCAFCRDGE